MLHTHLRTSCIVLWNTVRASGFLSEGIVSLTILGDVRHDERTIPLRNALMSSLAFVIKPVLEVSAGIVYVIGVSSPTHAGHSSTLPRASSSWCENMRAYNRT